MSVQQSQLLINEPPLQLLPSLAVKIGLNEAIFLQQVHYWMRGKSGKEHEGRRWIFNTQKEWQDQFPFWSEDTIGRTVRSLRRQGMLLTTSALNKNKVDRTLWYTINYEGLNQSAISRNGPAKPRNGPARSQNAIRKIAASNHETTHETSTESESASPKLITRRRAQMRAPRAQPLPAIKQTMGYDEIHAIIAPALGRKA